MKLADLAGGVLPRSLHYRIERVQVAEFYEMGVRVCFPLHGHGENRGGPDERTYSIRAQCWRAGHHDIAPVQLELLAAS